MERERKFIKGLNTTMESSPLVVVLPGLKREGGENERTVVM